MKLLGSTKIEIRKDKNGEDVPPLEITKIVLVYCNIVNNNYNKVPESYLHLKLMNRLVTC